MIHTEAKLSFAPVAIEQKSSQVDKLEKTRSIKMNRASFETENKTKICEIRIKKINEQ